MRNLLLSVSLLLVLLSESPSSQVIALSDGRDTRQDVSPAEDVEPLRPELAVHLSTSTGRTIRFEEAERGETDHAEPQASQIPHLVLNRNGVPTPGFERTLVITLDDLTLPQSGLYVDLTIETQRKDPDRQAGDRIQVWEERRFIGYDPRLVQAGYVQFNVTFRPMTTLDHQTIKTPTDYYRCQIAIHDGQGNLIRSYAEDYAFLMENQWRVPLPNVLEEAPGAAPDELLIYYYDMVPFQTDSRDPETQLPRQQVDRYIQTELIPPMVKAFEIQTNLWDFPWYPEWSSYRKDEDPKTLSVALGGDRTWFHGSAPSLGHAMISIRVDGSFGEYASLTDGIMSVFHHELFHNQQRNISLHFAGTGNVAGQDQAWEVFSEGTAVLASSVAQPEVQFAPMAYSRSYLKRANAFIGSDGAIGGGLNKSYKSIPYHTALYWRFLYENCGGITADGEDPARGLQVIRHALEALYQGEIVQVNSSTDVAGAFPRIMDRALQSTPSCRFQTYEETLIRFARAIYLLRSESGRCESPADFARCGLLDPQHLYQTPPADAYVVEAQQPMQITGSIPSSFGIDLNELTLSPSMQGRSLELVFTSSASSSADFHVEVWKTRTFDEGTGMEGQSLLIGEPILAVAENGSVVLEIESLSSGIYDGLGLIVIRTDPYEESETSGTYSIKLLAK